MNIPVFMSCDDRYAPFIATTCCSIVRNTTSQVDFYILDFGISPKNTELLNSYVTDELKASINFIKINSDNKNLIEVRYLTRAMYGRFHIPEYFHGHGKVIYTDVDVIFMDDICKLYNEDLGNHILGACWEDFNEQNSINQNRNLSLGINRCHKYFSSGLLIIDVDKWREQNILHSLLTLHDSLKSILECPDQDILNAYFRDDYKQLDSKYVVCNQRLNSFFKNGKFIGCSIRHFNGPIKPWTYKEEIAESVCVGSNIFWGYAKETPFYAILDRNAKTSIKKEGKQKNIFSRLARKIKSILRH